MFTVTCASFDTQTRVQCTKIASVVVLYGDARHEPMATGFGDWQGYCDEHHVVEVQEQLATGLTEADFTVISIPES